MGRRYTSAIGRTGEPGPAAELQRQAGERELAHAVARELLEVERLDDVDALADEQDHVPGQRAELRVDLARHVPRDVVGADRQRLVLGAPARAARVDPAGGEERLGVLPQRAGAGAHEDHVAGRDLEPVGGALEVLRADRVAGVRAVEQHAAREQRRDRVRPQLGEALGRLHLRVDLDAAVHARGSRPGGRTRRCACRSARPSRAGPRRSCAPPPAPPRGGGAA